MPWTAFVDHKTNHVFVQTCEAPRKAVFTAGAAVGSYPFIEVQNLAPVTRLGPRKSISLVQNWYSTLCPGPVVDVTAAGVVSSPLSLLRSKDGSTWVAATAGVFVVGTAAIVFRDAKGAELKALALGTVHPLRTIVLKRAVELPPATSEVALEIRGLDGKRVGHLGKILLGAP